MLGAFRKNKFFAWAMMGILVAAMAGFGLGGVLSGGLVTTVASVGDQDIEVDEFVSAFRDRQSVITQQLGRPISTIEARSVGLDQVVLQELIRGATLEGEALEQGIGVSDRIVQAELLRQPGFQDLSGGFDREMYEFALQNAGLTASQYDAQLRSQAQQQLLATAIAEGASVGTAAANAILAFTGERRGVSTLTLPAIAFLDEVGEPSTADLQAHLSDFEAQFERPETREVSYAVLDPEQVAATMPISDDEVIAAYEADVDRFITPERRIVDRISFPDEAAAEAGRAALEDGSLTTVQIAQERGLQPQDLSLGLVTATDLTRAEREVVFGDTGVGIVGPVATDLGPAVFVINAVLEAQETPRNEALTILREELALEAAQDMMLDDLITAEELVAGGATVEELARETAFELASASVTTTGALGVPAEDIEFITAAFSADQGLETDPVEGASGRIYVLRIDAIIPPQVPPLAEIEDEVLVDWRNAQAITAARAAADALLLSSGDALADGAARFGGEVTTTPPVTRDGNAAGLPPGALAEVFEADEAGTLFTFNRDDGVVIARLDAIEPFAAEDGSVLSDFISQRQAEGLATDLVAYFATARANERGLSVDRIALDQILSQLP